MKKVLSIIIIIICVSYIFGISFRLTKSDLQTATEIVGTASPFSINKIVFEFETFRKSIENYDKSKIQTAVLYYDTASSGTGDDFVFNSYVRIIWYDYNETTEEWDSIDQTEWFNIAQLRGYDLPVVGWDQEEQDEYEKFGNHITNLFKHNKSVILGDVLSVLYQLALSIFSIAYMFIDLIVFTIPSVFGLIKATFYILGF